MSVIRPKPPEDPIEYRAAAAVASGGVAAESLDGMAAALGRARADLLAAAGVERPDRLLDDYNTGGRRADSHLFAILQAARRIRDTVDRVVVLGDGCGVLGARAIFESCAHPWHNDLSRGERGGRPRLSFLGPALDNDILQGLLDLVAPAGKPHSGDLLDQWALVVAGETGGGPEMAAAVPLLGAALCASLRDDPAAVADRMVPITGRSGWLADLAAATGCTSVFAIPDDAAAGADVFTAQGLLPAAVVGIDVVRLLQGAAAMNRRFREAPLTENPVLRFAGVSRLMAERRSMARVLTSRSSQLDAVSRWRDRFVTDHGVPLITELVVSEPRREPLVVPAARVVDTPSPPATDTILLPRIDEHAIGQLCQLLVLANLVERRL